MKNLKRLFKYVVAKENFLPLLVILILTIPAVWHIMQVGYFSMHDDLQAIRQLIMEKCFQDGQLPCRWSQDMGYGYGYPILEFYPPFPYYLGEAFRMIRLQFIDVIKILFLLNFLVSGFGMYILAKNFWGKWGGVLSAVLYIYAPYHALDIYVRGAMNEAWALAWFPYIFWSIYSLIKTGKWRYVIFLSLPTAFLMLSHNPMLMIFTPIALVWSLFWLWQTKAIKILPKLVVAGIFGFGLAAFFTLPVIFEERYVHVETLIIGYFNYLAHFASLDQMFISRFWGFGESMGVKSTISFQIGYLHWGLSIVSLLVAAALFKKRRQISLMIILVFFLTAFYTFMVHQKSSFIWDRLAPLAFLQFPWRFLTVVIFGSSFLAGSSIFLLEVIGHRTLKILLLSVLLVATVFLYQGYFNWRSYDPLMTDQLKFSGHEWQLQITAGIFDYLPKGAPLPPPNPPHGDAEILTGVGSVKTVFKNSIDQRYEIDIQKNSTLQINTFYFPGWKYFVNGKEVVVDLKSDQELGRPRIDLLPGKYLVTAQLTKTPIRQIGDLISLISWTVLVLILIKLLIVKIKSFKLKSYFPT